MNGVLRRCDSTGCGFDSVGGCSGCAVDGDCNADYHCDAGSCVIDSCPQGELFCSGDGLMQCNANGSGSSLQETCVNGCGGNPAACFNTQGCTDNWDCPWSEHCNGGSCVPDVCQQGDTYCDGDDLRQCNYEGSDSYLLDACPDGCGGSPAECLGACSASEYWSPTFVASADYNFDLDISLRAEFMVDSSGDGVNIRICRVGGDFAEDTIHVTFEENASHGPLVMTEGEVSSLGLHCTAWEPLDHVQTWQEGEPLGGDVQVVSPGYCGMQWGWGCTNDPGCGFCWFMSIGDMTRTCLE